MNEENFFKKTQNLKKKRKKEFELQMLEIFKHTTNLFEIHTHIYVHICIYVSLFYCLKIFK